jgi:hypothetical protein
MGLFRRKEKKFEYGQQSKIALALAIELYNRHGYQEEKPKVNLNSRSIDFLLEDLRDEETGSFNEFVAPRLGLPGYGDAKLYIFSDLSNGYGFKLWVDTNDNSGIPNDVKQRNLEAKARIESAWASFELPYRE